MQKNLTFYTLFFKNSKNVFHIYCTKAGWTFLVNCFFFKNQNILLHVHVHVRCKQAQTPDVIYFKNKNEFPITYSCIYLALYNVHFSNNKKYTPYQQPVLLGCGIFFHRVKNNVRCLWINSILYFFHVQQCLFNTCN